MNISNLSKHLKKVISKDLLSVERDGWEFDLVVNPEAILRSATELKKLKFDYFSYMTAVDNLNRLDLIYRVYSVKEKQAVNLKTSISRKDPAIDSVTSVWDGANWHEREAADLFGIKFNGHPDPRPLLLPEGWQGHPLLKDYEDEEMVPRPEFY